VAHKLDPSRRALIVQRWLAHELAPSVVRTDSRRSGRALARERHRAPRAPRSGAPSLDSSSLDTSLPVPLPDGFVDGVVHNAAAFNLKLVRYPDSTRVVMTRGRDSVGRSAHRSDKPKCEVERWEKNKHRAKAQVRHLCRCLGADHLWTFGKRGKFAALDEVWLAWRSFGRLMRAEYGVAWAYVAVPELHADGETWHLHAAVRGFWDVVALRRLWYRALGGSGDESGQDTPGNVDAKYIRQGQRGPCSHRAIAGYISAYIGKGFGAVASGRRLFAPSECIRPLEVRRFHCEWPASPGEIVEEVCNFLVERAGCERGVEVRHFGEGFSECWIFESVEVRR
jgi:hypothetical protein